jgi:hypothetical protein
VQVLGCQVSVTADTDRYEDVAVNVEIISLPRRVRTVQVQKRWSGLRGFEAPPASACGATWKVFAGQSLYFESRDGTSEMFLRPASRPLSASAPHQASFLVPDPAPAAGVLPLDPSGAVSGRAHAAASKPPAAGFTMKQVGAIDGVLIAFVRYCMTNESRVFMLSLHMERPRPGRTHVIACLCTCWPSAILRAMRVRVEMAVCKAGLVVGVVNAFRDGLKSVFVLCRYCGKLRMGC